MQRILLAGLLLALATLPAQAALQLCNRTSYILYAATSGVSGGAGLTQGWTRLTPGSCAVALKTALTGQGTLVYARSALAHSGPQRAWGGNVPICVRGGNFILRQAVAASCGEDAYSVPFAAIDTRGRADWTMNFDERPALASLTAAQLAGVKRLLKDNGFAVGPLNGAPDKATGKSLQAFRARMHFAPEAGNDALFAALEEAAQKRTAPAGYTVCNDTEEELLVAMGDAHGKAFRAAGGASRAAPAPAPSPRLWPATPSILWRRNAMARPLAMGHDKFCVTPQEFEIQGRANCAPARLCRSRLRAHADQGLKRLCRPYRGQRPGAPISGPVSGVDVEITQMPAHLVRRQGKMHPVPGRQQFAGRQLHDEALDLEGDPHAQMRMPGQRHQRLGPAR